MLEEKAKFDWTPDQDPFSQQGILNLPADVTPLHQMGDFAEMGLGLGYWPSSFFINLLEFVHVSTQLPWWASICLVTLMARISLFPILLKTYRNQAIAGFHTAEMEKAKQKMKEASQGGNPVEMKQQMQTQWALYRSWGYKPFLGFIGFLQIPILFGMFRMCTMCSRLPVPGWETGGTLWFTNLTDVDPFYILPIISGVTTAATILVCSLWGTV